MSEMDQLLALVVVTFLFGLMIYIAIRFWVFVFKSLFGRLSYNTRYIPPSQSSETAAASPIASSTSYSDDTGDRDYDSREERRIWREEEREWREFMNTPNKETEGPLDDTIDLMFGIGRYAKRNDEDDEDY